jgi:ribosomal protein L37E
MQLIVVNLKKLKPFLMSSKNQIHIKCQSCETFNENKTHCESCGKLIDPQLIRKEEQRKRKVKLDKIIRKQSDDVVALKLRALENHKFLIVRALAYILQTIWWILISIGGLLAWIAGTIAA